MSFFYGRSRKSLKTAARHLVRPKVLRLEERDVPAQILVTNLLDDSSGGTLREAVQQANSDGVADEIVFQSGLTGTITLEQGEIEVYGSDLTITGPGSGVITIDADSSSRIFDAEENFTITGLTLQNGAVKGDGGAIRATGQLTVVNSVITGSRASGGAGGGIFSGGYTEGGDSDNGVTIQNSVISENFATYYGGGIAIYDPELDSVINNTTISGNEAPGGEGGGDGGGIAFYAYDSIEVGSPYDGDLTISNTTISGNEAGDEGGGVYISFDRDSLPDSNVTIINSTISSNFSEDDGGGVFTNAGDHVNILNSTIAYNITEFGVGGGVATRGQAEFLTLISTIVANNVSRQSLSPPGLVSPPPPTGDADDLSGFFNAEYSLIEAPGDAVINDTVVDSNIFGKDPNLGALQNNGGLTETHAIDTTSPVYNNGSNPRDLAYDQRGNPFNRTIPTTNSLNTDIGAYEIQPPPPPPPAPTPTPTGNVVPFVVGTGPGGGPHVRVLDPKTGAPILDFLAYDKEYQGGVNVAVGDVTGDGIADIITAPASDGGSDIRVFDSRTGELLTNFLAYPDFFGGVYVATGDIDGDGVDDIITGAGRNGGPHVRVFRGGDFNPIRDFLAYTDGYHDGVSVAAGDVNGDSVVDIITGSATISSHVQAFDGTTLTLLSSFLAYDPHYDHGVNVAAADFNDDNIADIVTASGTQSSNVRIYNPVNLQLLGNFIAYPDFDGGTRVGIAYIDGTTQLVTGSGTGGGPHVRIFAGGLDLMPNLELVVYEKAFQGGVNVSG